MSGAFKAITQIVLEDGVMAVCSHCGYVVRDDQQYCPACGNLLDASHLRNLIAGARDKEKVYGVVDDAIHKVGETLDHYSNAQTPLREQEATPAPTPIARLIIRAAPHSETFEGIERSALGDTQERDYVLNGGDVAIGRAPSCEIVLDGDQLASRRHALLRPKGSGFTVVDLGSSNGTFVNDIEIREAVTLNDGDRITVGAHELVFRLSVGAAPFAQQSRNGVAAADVPQQGAVSSQNVAPVTPSAQANGQADMSGIEESAMLNETNPFLEAAHPILASSASEAQEGPSVALEPEQSAPGAVTEMTPTEEESHNVVQQPLHIHSVAVDDAAMTVGGAATQAVGGMPVDNLDALRTQLTEVSTALARKADEEARMAGRLRSLLSDTRNTLTDLLAALSRQASHESESVQTPLFDGQSSQQVDELVSVARQAAEHPRHLDYLTSFAAHAHEIAMALEALQSIETQRQAQTPRPEEQNEQVRTMLADLRARLDEALS